MSHAKRFAIYLSAAAGLAAAMMGMAAIVCTVRAYNFYRETPPRFRGASTVRPDSEIGYVPAVHANLQRIIPPTFSAYSDDLGTRVSQPGVIAPSQVDVIVSGCSFTWGDGVEAEQAYPNLLQQKLSARVLNAGVRSFGTATSLLWTKRLSELKPKVLVYAFVDDHTQRSLSPCTIYPGSLCRPVAFVDFDRQLRPFLSKPLQVKVRMEPEDRDAYTEHAFGLRDLLWAAKRDWALLTGNDAPTINASYQNRSPSLRVAALNYLLGEWVALSRNMGARLIVTHVPSPNALGTAPSELLDALEPLFRDNQLDYVDVGPSFRAYADLHGARELWAHPTDTHPSPAAHGIIAEQLAPYVERQLTGSSSPLYRRQTAAALAPHPESATDTRR